MTLSSTTTGVNTNNTFDVKFVSAVDETVSPKLCALENFNFTSSISSDFTEYTYYEDGFSANFIPLEAGIHHISIPYLYNYNKKDAIGFINVAYGLEPDLVPQVIQNTEAYFSYFQKMIDDAPEGSVIVLKNDFIFNGINDKEGIIINKDIEIDGQGHFFDAKSRSGIFQSRTGTITLKNIVFTNGNQVSADDGGAIRILNKAKYSIQNCIFYSNHALQDGGAIYNEGKDLYIRDSTFTYNRCEGADKLNDCDGGAIHSKAYTYISNCNFTNNFANDNGGAIYVTGGLQISSSYPCYLSFNIANKGKGGTIYTNKFTEDVKYVSFIYNRAGDNALISDDGGAVYINDENHITFSSCLFANNHCTDEGGAIYLDDMDSHLTLRNNIFIGNAADDEGQSVFNCGYYDKIENNL